jgi:hypothetical protein
MTDISKRLRNWDDGKPASTPREMPWPRDMMLEAATEIERLHAWRDAKNDACAELEKENERLLAALTPFANSAEIPDSIMSGEMGDEAIIAVTFKLGDFRRARCLLPPRQAGG